MYSKREAIAPQRNRHEWAIQDVQKLPLQKNTTKSVMPNMKNGRSSFSEKKIVFEKIEFKNHFRGAKFKPAATTPDSGVTFCAEHFLVSPRKRWNSRVIFWKASRCLKEYLIVPSICRFYSINIFNVRTEYRVLFKMIATVHGGVNINYEHDPTFMKKIESPGMLKFTSLRGETRKCSAQKVTPLSAVSLRPVWISRPGSDF